MDRGGSGGVARRSDVDKGKSKVNYTSEYDVGSSSRAPPHKAGKEVWEEEAAAAALVNWPPYPGCRRRDSSLFLNVLQAQPPPQPQPQAAAAWGGGGGQGGSVQQQLHHQIHLQDYPSSGMLTPDHRKVPTNVDADRNTNNFKVQRQLPTETIKERPFLDLLLGEEDFDLPPLVPEDTNFYSSPKMIELPKVSSQDNNALETAELRPPRQISNREYIVSGSSADSVSQFSGAPAKVEQVNHITVLNKHGVEDLPVQSSSSSRSALGNFADIMAVQEAYFRGWFDPDQDIPLKLKRQSTEAMKNHYARDVEIAYSGRHPANTIAPGPGRISGFSQIQRSGGTPDSIHRSGSGLNNRDSEFQFLLQQIKHPTNHSVGLIHIKGHVPAFSADPNGSRFIQQKLGTATTGEIVMVYQEIMPTVHTLVIDPFANYAIQKLLEHGPPVYRRKVISNLVGHALSLSLNLYGCRVIQKAIEISDLDLKIKMAKELGSNLLKCVRDQHANHVVQKCLECVPPQYIQFIYKTFCGKAKMLSSHPYGCRVIQKVLEFCDDSQIMHALVSEIVGGVNELSADQFGNYVVQYILEHGGPRERLIIVLKFAGRIVHMSHQKFSSNVIEKCLMYGSHQDRQQITNEILCAGGGQTADHLLNMMINQYANYVIQKMIETADEWQFDMIVDVVKRNMNVLIKYTHGRHVITQVQRLLSARGRRTTAPRGSLTTRMNAPLRPW